MQRQLFDVDAQETDNNDDRKSHQGGKLTDEDFGDDEVERITGGDEKISGSDVEAEKANQNGEGGQTVYSDDE